jgi:DNA-binding MarR family transcriptional regulator
VDQGYLSRIIGSFIRSGLVSKSHSRQDGRFHIIRLTKRGKAVFAELEAGSERSAAEALSHLPPDEQGELARLMEGFGSFGHGGPRGEMPSGP